MDFVAHSVRQMSKEPRRRLAIDLHDHLYHREFAGSGDGDNELELPFLNPGFGNFDLEIAGRVSLECLALGLVAVHIG